MYEHVCVYIYMCGFESTKDVYIYIYIYIFTNPSGRAGYVTRPIFKRSLTGLNSEFFLLLD